MKRNCIYTNPTERRQARAITIGNAGVIITIIEIIDISISISISIGISISISINVSINFANVRIIILIVIIITTIITQSRHHCAFALPVPLPQALSHLCSPLLTLQQFLAPTKPSVAPAVPAFPSTEPPSPIACTLAEGTTGDGGQFVGDGGCWCCVLLHTVVPVSAA